MSLTIRQRNGLRAMLRLAHPAPAANVHRPYRIGHRVIVVAIACLLVPVLIVLAELVRSAAKGWFA